MRRTNLWEVMLAYLCPCGLTGGEAFLEMVVIINVSMELHSITIQLILLSSKLERYCVVSVGVHLPILGPLMDSVCKCLMNCKLVYHPM